MAFHLATIYCGAGESSRFRCLWMKADWSHTVTKRSLSRALKCLTFGQRGREPVPIDPDKL